MADGKIMAETCKEHADDVAHKVDMAKESIFESGVSRYWGIISVAFDYYHKADITTAQDDNSRLSMYGCIRYIHGPSLLCAISYGICNTPIHSRVSAQHQERECSMVPGLAGHAYSYQGSQGKHVVVYCE